MSKAGTNVCPRIIRLMNNQTRSQRLLFQKERRRESDDKNAVAIVEIVPQLGCVSQDSDALVSQRGKQYRGQPMQRVLGPIRKVRLTKSTRRQASIGERKDHRLEKYKSNLNTSEVRTLLNLRTGPTKRLKDKSDVPKARLGILSTYLQAQSERQNYILLACGKVVLPVAS